MTADDRGFARIERALGEVGKDLEPPPGWEGKVLASGVASPRTIKWWMLAIPALAAAAVIIAVLVWPRPAAPAKPTLALAITRGAYTVRSSTAAVGDELRATAAGGAAHRALWIYRDDTLVAACPGDARCTHVGDRWGLGLKLDAIGRYRVVYLHATTAIAAPTGRYDQDLAGALRAGASQRTEIVDVR